MKLSIVIPTYNRAKLLPRAVTSVLRQQFKNWELVIVDDGSEDNTREIIQGFIDQDKRIKYFEINKNRGFMEARNVGVKKATGDWVCFFDSDDEYLPGALTTINEEVKKIEKEVGVVLFMLEEADAKKRLGFRRHDASWKYYQPSYEEVVLKKDIRQDMHRCLRRRVAQKYPYSENNPGLETLYYADLAKVGVKFLYVNRIVVRIHQHEMSHSQVRFARWPRKFAQAYSQLLARHAAVFAKHRQRLFDYQIRVGRCYLEAKDPRFIWWVGKAFFNQPEKFIKGVKRILGV